MLGGVLTGNMQVTVPVFRDGDNVICVVERRHSVL